jgi:monoamine oxidase
MDRRTFLQSALAVPAFMGARVQPAGRRVVILGAGLAGLSAAYELDRAGYDVTVLEARTRPGGRVHTLREPFSDGLYAEAGAARIQDSHAFTLRYVKEFGLSLDPFFPSEGARITRVAGRRLPTPPRIPPDLEQIPLTFSDEERKLGFLGCLKKYVFSHLLIPVLT